MISKSIIQYLLIIILIIISIFFYKKYIETDDNLAQTQVKILKNNENSVIEENKDNSNIIEELRYVSKDLSGNTYIINAKSAEIQENKIDQVQLSEVLAKNVDDAKEILMNKIRKELDGCEVRRRND